MSGRFHGGFGLFAIGEEEKKMKAIIEQAATTLTVQLSGQWKQISKADLEKPSRKGAKMPEYCLEGSFLYVAYENDNVLYVGESFVSVRGRFLSDGSGAHYRKVWYERLTHVQYVRFDRLALPDHHRKLLEQALAIVLKPEF